jgi:ABC-type branched-subunit amino acid transport system ATPase component
MSREVGGTLSGGEQQGLAIGRALKDAYLGMASGEAKMETS